MYACYAFSIVGFADKSKYYKPWELLPADEARIKAQLAEVEAAIKKESEEFNTKFPVAAAAERETTNASKETVGEPQAEPPSVSNVSVDTINTTNPPVQDSQSEQGTTEKITPGEHNGEVVVVAEEDTVIY